MPDSYSDDMIEQLIKYTDGELNAAEKESLEKLLQSNITLQQRYLQLQAAKQAIRSQGIKQRVHQIHNEYMQAIQPEKKETAKVIKHTSFLKTFMRVAAVFFIAIAGYGTFLYSSTTNQSEYNNNFIAYHASVSRGNGAINDLTALYNTGNYDDVIKSFNSKQNKTQQDYFLAAQSYLQLNNAAAAIDAFKQVENLNNNSTEKYFQQETDYYMAMAYIKNGQVDLAREKLDRIKADKQHLFYDKAKSISSTKLKILEWKNKK